MCTACGLPNKFHFLSDSAGDSDAIEQGSSADGAGQPLATIEQLAGYLVNGYWEYKGTVAHHWTSNTITYNLGNLNAAEQQMALAALSLWQDVANITFVQTSGTANISFNHDGSMQARTTGNWMPSGEMVGTAVVNISSNWVTTYGSSLGNYSYQTYIHEIGHALGLGHQGAYNGSATYGTHNVYANDTWQYSIMSYFAQSNYGGASYRFVMSPQMADIYAIQSIYGAATDTRTGDTVYGFNATAESVFNFASYASTPAFTIYDSDGADTLDCSDYSQNQTIDLRPGAYSSIGGLSQNIGIYLTATVESAIGGSGSDTITGNAADNTLFGGVGNDTLIGGAGNDYLDGGAGADVLTGGIGDDIYYVDNLGDSTIENGVEGLDTVLVAVSGYVLPASVEIGKVVATSGMILLGNDAANVLYGNIGNDTLNGGGGNDTVVYSGLSSEYHLYYNSLDGTYTISDLRFGNPNGSDLLVNIEQILFDDGLITLDAPIVAAPIITSFSPDSNLIGDGITNATAITLTGTATANSLVHVYDGQALLGTATADSSGAWSYVTASLPIGLHSFTATATAGGEISSPSIALTVTIDTTAATVSSVAASGSGITAGNGILAAGSVVTLTVSLSEAVTVAGGTPTLSLNNGGTATYSGGSGSSALTFSYTVAAGQNTSDLAITAVNLGSATVRDAAGNAANLAGAVGNPAGTLQIDTTVVNNTPNTPPDIVVSNVVAQKGQAFAATSLFTASDREGNAIVAYEFWDDNAVKGPADDRPAVDLGGHFLVSGVRQGAGAAIHVAAADLGATTFQTGSGADVLWVRAYDGSLWSNWSEFTVTAPVNHVPVVTAGSITVQKKAVVSATSLFAVSDADGDAIVSYRFYDDNKRAGTSDDGGAFGTSGYFTVNGVVQAAGQAFDLAAADLGSVQFHTGSNTSDLLWVTAFDGLEWSPWQSFKVNATNRAPEVSVTNVMVAPASSNGGGANQAGGAQIVTVGDDKRIGASHLFNVFDADGDTIVQYEFWDSTPGWDNGNFVFKGVVQGANAAISVQADKLDQLHFRFASASDLLWVRAFDGEGWGAWKSFTASGLPAAPNGAVPTVTGADISTTRNHVFAADDLFSFHPGGGGQITLYQFVDGLANGTDVSGRFEFNGDAVAPGRGLELSADELSDLTYTSGQGADLLWARAFDGVSWSAWASITVTAPYNKTPVASVSNLNVAKLATLAAADLFSVTDPDGDGVAKYQVWDGGLDSKSGHFVLNGVAQGAGVAIDVAPGQLTDLEFQAGQGSDLLWVRAFDGLGWGAWQSFTVSAPQNRAPVASVSDKSVAKNAIVDAASLFSVSDPDGDAIMKYQIWDSGLDSKSGHFVLNGIAQGAGAAIDVAPGQLNDFKFQAGQGSDLLWVRAFDGLDWGAWQSLTVTAPVNKAPSVQVSNQVLAANSTVSADSLFVASDPDGDSITRYEFWDSTMSAGSGHFEKSGSIQVAGTALGVLADELDDVTFVTGDAGGTDELWVRAFDGHNWGNWMEFWISQT
jgi:Ca2+-binding RTX toxin-like protein